MIVNCTFYNNTATSWRPDEEGQAIYNENPSPIITNNIFWGVKEPQILNDGFSFPQITYCNVAGSYPGEGNIDLDPLFVDPENGDFNLQYISPCIDAASNDASGIHMKDLYGEPRIINGVVDMGAYEFQGIIEGDYVKIPVFSAAASDYQDGNPPEHTLDGNLNTRWSALGDGQWIEYDLRDSTTVGYVKIAWFKGDRRRAAFDIEVSGDGANWIQAYSGQSSGTTLNLASYDFNDVTARYVRTVGHGNTENVWNSITEAEIYGKNGGSP